MSRDDIIRMAKEAGFSFGMTEPVVMVRYIPQDGLERFAELVRADEREACAKVADRYVGADPIADAIRARGQA